MKVMLESAKHAPVAGDALFADYWDNRATTYSNGVEKEFRTREVAAWRAVLQSALDQVAPAGIACSAPSAPDSPQGGRLDATIRVADLGCGPGFFEVLLSNMGCAVTAVDASSSMLENAWRNVSEYGRPSCVRLVRADVSDTGIPAGSCDLAISRNVTWLVRDPRATYREWRRILRPGGLLVVFDANWYRYLADRPTDALRRAQQEDESVLGWTDDAKASASEERECERIARKLPLTYELRPEWDTRTLADLGYSGIRVDRDVWKRVWTPGEQAYYASSPLFMISAVR